MAVQAQPQWGLLLRSRSRAMVSVAGFGFLLLGSVVYLFFASVSPPGRRFRDLRHPRFRPDQWAPAVHHAIHGTSDTLSQSLILLDPAQFSPKDLMKLPVWRHTASDPLDPLKTGFKPMRDSNSPWSPDHPSGRLLTEKLSPVRFPDPESPHALGGSASPRKPVWPRPEILRPKSPWLREPISTHEIAGLDTSYVWTARPKINTDHLPKVQWSGFSRGAWELPMDRTTRLRRKGWVRRAFQHVWEGYKAKAWGHDELRPISGSFDDPFSGWGATLVDCLDTLLIMNLTREYDYARTHIKALDWAETLNLRELKSVDLSKQNSPPPAFHQPTVPFFETVIRYFGGLISAYDLCGDKLMLERAEELAEWLLPAFGTTNGLPYLRYQQGTNPKGKKFGRSCLAELGSLTLEFTRLAQLTSKDYYYHVVQRITDVLGGEQWSSPSRPGTLLPTYIDPDYPSSLTGVYTFGGMADSYYEYLIKEFQLLGGSQPQYSQLFSEAIDSARLHLVKKYELEPQGGKNLTVIGDLNNGVYTPTLDHLGCFAGGMIGLGSKLLRRRDMDLALSHTDACVWAYETTSSGLGPERMSVMAADEHNGWRPVIVAGQQYREFRGEPVKRGKIHDGRYLGRPETIESVFYMWRITGDKEWQDKGWRMFTNWMEACITEFGFADLKEVNSSPPLQADKEESFVLAETLKYYYLLFSDPDSISLDDYVFNTEAHPFSLPKKSPPGTARSRVHIWSQPDYEVEREFSPPAQQFDKTARGYGTFVQQWARVDYAKLDKDDVQQYKAVFGIS